MEDKKRNILFSEEQISTRIKELGEVISRDYQGKNLYVLSLLRGSFVYAADLVRAIDLNRKSRFYDYIKLRTQWNIIRNC